MLSLMIITREGKAADELHSGLIRNGFDCTITSHGNGVMEQLAQQSPDLMLLEMDGRLVNSGIEELAQRIKRERPLPIIALIDRQTLDRIDRHLEVDDFLTSPYDTKELTLRIKRLLNRTGNGNNRQCIECGDLVIDLARCEVTLEGRLVELTFREYELLKFLARNRNRVFSRQALLDKVWGYDYYGGDRTVDVHIRRLRSKIEDSGLTFIETVRNIGYRFK